MKHNSLARIILASLLLLASCAQIAQRTSERSDAPSSPELNHAGDLTCSTVTNTTERTTCIADLALSIKNSALCAQAPDSDTCYLNYAIIAKDATVCASIKNPGAKTICTFSSEKKNS